MLTKFFQLSGQAQTITVSMGSLSAVSSLLIISIILRSPSKLSTVYHKIMFSLSSWDTISSIAMALTTLPMPKYPLLDDRVGYVFPDNSKNAQHFYDFSGVVLGNIHTCTAQGFAITAGQAFAIASNATLSIYYMCSIRFQMTDHTAQKKLLPIMMVVSCVICLPISVTPLMMGLYNPQPNNPYCYFGSYPWLCNEKKEGFCIRGGSPANEHVPKNFEDIYHLVTSIVIGFSVFVMVVSMVLVVVSVFQTEMSAKRAMKNKINLRLSVEQEEQQDNMNHEEEVLSVEEVVIEIHDYFKETKSVLRLAMMYIGAFLVTWTWTIILLSLPSSFSSSTSVFKSVCMYGQLFGLPSQGFFNAFIFIYNKMHIARKCHPHLTFSQALKMVIFTPSIVPEVLVTSLDVVDDDIMNQRGPGPSGRQQGDRPPMPRVQRKGRGIQELIDILDVGTQSPRPSGHHHEIDNGNHHECDYDLSSSSNGSRPMRVVENGEIFVSSESSNSFDDDSSGPPPPPPPRPNLSEIQVPTTTRRAVVSSTSPSGHPFASTSISIVSTITQRTSYPTMLDPDAFSLTSSMDESQLSLYVQRRGEGYSPKKKKKKMDEKYSNKSPAAAATCTVVDDDDAEDEECLNSMSSSIPSGVRVQVPKKNDSVGGDVLASSSCGIISTMVKSFDESGSFQCVVRGGGEDDEDDDDDVERSSLSIGDLSGFGLSQAGGASSSFQS